MTSANSDAPKTTPSIRDLTVAFLKRSETENQFASVGQSEVEPYEVATGNRTEPRQAWNDGLQALKLMAGKVDAIKPPGDWATQVGRQAPAFDLAFAIGNHPSRVRDINAFLNAQSFSTFRASLPEPIAAAASLKNWAGQQLRKGDFAQALTAVALMRAAGDLVAAEQGLNDLRSQVTAESRSVFGNEEAGLRWQQGRWEEAARIWEALPESTPVLFDRGLSALFADRYADARAAFRKAIAALPDGDSWHHLASLYLALAEMRG